MTKFILQIFILLFSVSAYALENTNVDIVADKLEAEKQKEELRKKE